MLYGIRIGCCVLVACASLMNLSICLASGNEPASDATVSYAQLASERLELARRTLKLVEKSAKQPRLAQELDELGKRISAALADQQPFPRSLYDQIRALRRRIVFAHPALQFERLLINKRPPPGFNHQTDQYLGRYSGVGDGLVMLESWKSEPRERVLLRGKLPPGSVHHPDLSFDGKRILFAYCDHTESNADLRRFVIYEIDVEGNHLRQVTGTQQDDLARADGRNTVMIEDWDPCYLPDGGFAFVSTRNQGGVRCHFGDRYCPTYTLYRGELDGTAIKPMAFGEANEWDPSVLHDGRVIWTRWDYINRHDTLFQSLWTTRPDGTAPEHFYGNYTRNPCSIAEAKAIPGSHKVVATATAHHSFTAGSIIVIDPQRGKDGADPITRITPEVGFPETEGWPLGAYATPWPLTENLFLVAYSPSPHTRQSKAQATNDYAIYLIDTLGGRELIYQDDSMSSFSPIPVIPRSKPPTLPAQAAPAADNSDDASGVFVVQNVYEGAADLKPGSVKSLRVVRVDPQTTQAVPPRSHVLFETAKKILGTVPVSDDGSVAFRAPAGKSLLFQLLDENGMAVMSMRSFTYLHPGETVSCVGCHAPSGSAPRVQRPVEDLIIHELKPPAGPKYETGLSFARTVQPVLDRYCIDCHGLNQTEGGINLLGTIEARPPDVKKLLASTAYNSLVSRKGLVALALRNQETDYSRPKDYYAHAGRLAAMLLKGDANHQPLDAESLERMVNWLDLNAQFFGDYSWNKVEWRRSDPAGERRLRAYVRTTLGEGWSKLPFAALVNVAEPAESRVLLGPLAIEAGGWGLVKKGGWSSRSEPGFRKLQRLVRESIAPRRYRDIDGTCGQTPCICGSCWVRKIAQFPLKQAGG